MAITYQNWQNNAFANPSGDPSSRHSFNYTPATGAKALVVFVSNGASTAPALFENKLTWHRNTLIARHVTTGISAGTGSNSMSMYIVLPSEGFPLTAGTFRLHGPNLAFLIVVCSVVADGWVEIVDTDTLAAGSGANPSITMNTGTGPTSCLMGSGTNRANVADFTMNAGFTLGHSFDIGGKIHIFVNSTSNHVAGGNIAFGYTAVSHAKAICAVAFRETIPGTLTRDKIRVPLVASAIANTVNLPAGWSPGMVALAWGRRNTAATIAVPSGWTALPITSGTDLGGTTKLAWRVLQAGDTSIGTWTNATDVCVIVYPNLNTTVPFGNVAGKSGIVAGTLLYTDMTPAIAPSHILYLHSNYNTGTSVPWGLRPEGAVGYSYDFTSTRFMAAHAPYRLPDANGIDQSTSSGGATFQSYTIELRTTDDPVIWQHTMIEGMFTPQTA